MRLSTACLFASLALFNPAILAAAENLLWEKEFSEPVSIYASPDLGNFVLAYVSGEDAVVQSSGIAVYDRNWNMLWRDYADKFESVSWNSGVISVRVSSTTGGEGASENAGVWRILDARTGNILHEYQNYAAAEPVLDFLPIFKEAEAVKDSLRRLTGQRWRISAISEDGGYVEAYNPFAAQYTCNTYKKTSGESGEYWERVGACGGGELLNGGNFLGGENVIPLDDAEMSQFVQNKQISVKVTVKSAADKELWARKLSVNHELSSHVLLAYPIAWYSNGKVVVYTGPAMQIFDMDGAPVAQVPYAQDMATAKQYDNRIADVEARRLILTGTNTYIKFYCWDQQEQEQFQKRTMKLYSGSF